VKEKKEKNGIKMVQSVSKNEKILTCAIKTTHEKSLPCWNYKVHISLWHHHQFHILLDTFCNSNRECLHLWINLKRTHHNGSLLQMDLPCYPSWTFLEDSIQDGQWKLNSCWIWIIPMDHHIMYAWIHWIGTLYSNTKRVTMIHRDIINIIRKKLKKNAKIILSKK